MVASPKKAVAKAASPKKASGEYRGTATIYNAAVPAKDPKRVAAAAKAAATRRAKIAAKKKALKPKKVKKAKKAKKSKKVAKGKKGAKKGAKKTGVKRPLTGYFKFCGEKRAAVMKAHPTWKVTEVASELGKQWRGLSDAQKKSFK